MSNLNPLLDATLTQLLFFIIIVFFLLLSIFFFHFFIIEKIRNYCFARGPIGMEQHILKYEFHISKVLKFIEIY